jgi:hypothetical protein
VKIALIILQVVILTACTNSKKTELESLEGAASAFRTIFDISLSSATDKPKVLSCDVTGQEAMSFMMPLKARMDALMDAEKEAYRKDPKSFNESRNVEQCEKSCVCGLYARLFEALEVPAEALNKKAEAETQEQRLKCAQELKELCDSKLLKELRAEAN